MRTNKKINKSKQRFQVHYRTRQYLKLSMCIITRIQYLIHNTAITNVAKPHPFSRCRDLCRITGCPGIMDLEPLSLVLTGKYFLSRFVLILFDFVSAISARYTMETLHYSKSRTIQLRECFFKNMGTVCPPPPSF